MQVGEVGTLPRSAQPFAGAGSGGNSILITLAPQSANWRTQVGPERTRVRSRTVKRSSAREALGNGISDNPIGGFLLARRGRGGLTFPDIPGLVHRGTGLSARAVFRYGDRAGGRPESSDQDARMPFPDMTRIARLLLALSLAIAAGAVSAQERPQRPPPHQTEQPSPSSVGRARDSVLRLLPADSVTEHSVEIPAGTLGYTATAGTLSLFDQSGDRSAAIYYTAYVAKNAEAASRPITFAFNGGPGAASAFLTLGLVGPRIAELMDNDPRRPGCATIRRPGSPSPIWSWSIRSAPAGAAPPSRTAPAPSTACGAMPRRWPSSWRSTSPRTAAARRRNICWAKATAAIAPSRWRARCSASRASRSGIVMVSPLMEAALMFSGNRFALGAALQLPSLAAAELERKGKFTPEAQAEAERFAMNEYLVTLAGAPPKGDRAREFYARLAEVSGLPEAVVTRSRGFIRDAYVKHLRSAERKIVSHYDATYAVADPYPDRETARGPDPLLDGLTRAYGSAFANYARDELGYKSDMTYVLLASDISGKWDWGEGGGRARPASRTTCGSSCR